MQSSRKILIVGAGIGGLASGHFLREAGRDVEIHERAPVPGGRIQLLEKEGSRVDVGTQYVHTNYLETLNFRGFLNHRDPFEGSSPNHVLWAWSVIFSAAYQSIGWCYGSGILDNAC